MDTLLAIVFYALSLFGINPGSQTQVDRIRSNGTVVLYSRIVAQPTGTRFECLRSASGQCHYTVFAAHCALTPSPAGQRAKATTCAPTAEHFALADGRIRLVPTSPTLGMCVSADAAIAGRDCD